MSEQYIFGIHAVQALLCQSHRKTKQLMICQSRQDRRVQELIDKAVQMNVPIQTCTMVQMNQQFKDHNHQGVVAKVAPLPEYGERDLVPLVVASKKPCLILILDGITDPHNLGACLRSADAAGVDFVVIPKDKSAGITPVVSKVACGATESIPCVRVTNLVRAIDSLKQEGVWIYGAAGEADVSLFQMDLKHHVAIVMGSEGDGLRRLTREHCDQLFSIPMQGSVSSLNVSVATGISLYEVLRQRQVS